LSLKENSSYFFLLRLGLLLIMAYDCCTTELLEPPLSPVVKQKHWLMKLFSVPYCFVCVCCLCAVRSTMEPLFVTWASKCYCSANIEIIRWDTSQIAPYVRTEVYLGSGQQAHVLE